MGKRREGRVLALQMLYACEAGCRQEDLLNFEWGETEVKKPSEEARLFAQLTLAGVLENLQQIDSLLESCLQNWRKERMRRVDLAILRLSIYALLFQQEIPYRVVIDEAVALAKSFSADDSYKFINGVLDAAARKTCQ